MTFTAQAQGGGTDVAISHRGWDRLEDRGAVGRERNQAGWAGLLPHYRAFLEA